MVSIAFMDCETDGLAPKVVHCVAVKTPEMPSPILLDDKGFLVWAKTMKPKKWVMHNGLGFDCWVVNSLIENRLINPMDVIDTMVISKTVDYNKFKFHSLKELGEFLGVYKGDYSGGWENFSPEMGEYCIQDVVVLEAIFNYYKPYIYDTSWAKAFRLEHDTAIISYDMNKIGFSFHKGEAEEMLKEVESELKVLEDALQEAFPPTLKEVNRLKYRFKKDGSLYPNVLEAKEKYPMTTIMGEELVCYDYIPFNPTSGPQRIDKLWEAGWKPWDMTDGHKKYLKDSKPQNKWSRR